MWAILPDGSDSVDVAIAEEYRDDNGGGQDEFDQKNLAIKRDSSWLNSCARALVKKFPNGSTPRGSRIAWAIPQGNEDERKAGWKRFWNHSVQVYLLLIIMLYISLVNYSLTVFDCSSANKQCVLDPACPLCLQSQHAEPLGGATGLQGWDYHHRQRGRAQRREAVQLHGVEPARGLLT